MSTLAIQLRDKLALTPSGKPLIKPSTMSIPNLPGTSSNTIETRHIPIPIFKGDSSERDLNGFIRACERFITSTVCDETTKINLVLSRLAGDAANAVYRGTHDFTWSSIKTLLLQRFGRWEIKIEDIVIEIQNVQPNQSRLIPLIHEINELICEGETIVSGAKIFLEPIAKLTLLKYMPSVYEDICKLETYELTCEKARRLDREGYQITKNKNDKRPTYTQKPSYPLATQTKPSYNNFKQQPNFNQQRQPFVPFVPRWIPNNNNQPNRHTYPPSPFTMRQKPFNNNYQQPINTPNQHKQDEDVTMRTASARPLLKPTRDTMFNIEEEQQENYDQPNTLNYDEYMRQCEELYFQSHYDKNKEESQITEDFPSTPIQETPT